MKKFWMMLICVTAASAWAGSTARIMVMDAWLNSSWTNAYSWADSETGERLGAVGAAIPADYDYLVADTRTCRTPLQTATFPGKSLTIGELGDNGTVGNLTLYPGTTGVRYTFAGEGLTLVRGRLQNLAGRNPHLTGNIKVVAPASAPFWLNDHSKDSALWFEDAVFSGEADAGVQIATWDAINQNNIWTATNTTAKSSAASLSSLSILPTTPFMRRCPPERWRRLRASRFIPTASSRPKRRRTSFRWQR